MSDYDNIYRELCGTLVDDIKKFENSCKELKKIFYPIIKENRKYQSIYNFDEQAADLKRIIHRKLKKCVVFGKTSSGKSSLINALLTEEILPTSCGSTSNSFVQIKASSSKKEYIRINNEVKTIESLRELTSLLCEGHIKDGSHVDLFYDPEKCSLLKENIEIVDTPGIDSDSKFDNSVVQYFKDVNLIILVVNSLSGISLIEKEFLRKFGGKFSKLHLLIVFNLWDFPDKAKNRDAVRKQYMESATKLLTDELGYSNENVSNRIFFLSAFERTNIFSSKAKTVRKDPLFKARNASFEQFLITLKDELATLEHKKESDCLNELHSLILKLFNNSNAVDLIMNKRNLYHQSLKESIIETDKILTLECVTKTFNEIYEEFINKGNFLFNDFLNNEKRINVTQVKEEINSKLKALLHSIAKCHEEQLKLFINKQIGESQNKNSTSWILTKFYFPNYFNFSHEILDHSVESNFFYNEMEKINQKINSGKNLTTMLSTCATVATFGFGVATGGVLGLTLAAGRMAVAGLVGYGLSNAVIENMKTPFEHLWKHDAKSIRDYLDKLKMKFIYNYMEFQKSLCENFDSEFYENGIGIQNKLNDMKVKIQKFENKTDLLSHKS